MKEQTEINQTWKLRKGLATILSANGFTQVEDPKIPTDKIPEFLKYLNENNIPSFGHIGYGIIHARLKPNTDLKPFYKKVKELCKCNIGFTGSDCTNKE